MPDFELPEMTEGQSALLAAEDFEAMFREISEADPEFVGDPLNPDLAPSYLRVDHKWMVDTYDWFDAFLWERNVENREEVWDADNYTEGLAAIAGLALLKSGDLSNQPFVGRMVVEYEKPWGGVLEGRHSLAYFVSEKGIFVLEPQNGRFVELSKYPNRKTILRVVYP
jgi:hypothetical protein